MLSARMALALPTGFGTPTRLLRILPTMRKESFDVSRRIPDRASGAAPWRGFGPLRPTTVRTLLHAAYVGELPGTCAANEELSVAVAVGAALSRGFARGP